MSSQSKRCGVVGKYHYLVIVILLVKLGKHIAQNVLVDYFKRLYLVFDLVSVTALIGSFHVNINKIAAVCKSVKSCLSLALEVGVYVACCALDLGDIHAAELCNAL